MVTMSNSEYLARSGQRITTNKIGKPSVCQLAQLILSAHVYIDSMICAGNF